MQESLIQYKFSFDNGNRVNHQLSLVNNSNTTIKLNQIQITINTDIEKPWGMLGQAWSNVKKDQQGNLYVYTLASPIDLIPGENLVLEYSVTNALGPVTNVAMPPQAVKVNNTLIKSVNTNHVQVNPHDDFEFNMYHANWGQYQYQRNMNDEYWADINCLTYAFIGFNESGDVFTLDNWADQLELPLLNLEQQNKPYLNKSIGFGGWTNAGKRMNTVFNAMAANPSARGKFVANAVSAVLQSGVNGIDIDWEYPAAQDAENFISLLQELRNALTKANIPNARLTIAAPAAIDKIHAFSVEQWKTIADLVDRISIMSYDYFGGFFRCCGFSFSVEIVT